MQELRQDIFPVCSFGRAENVFYQSSDSLCSRDLTFSEILLLIKDHPEPLFPSHILDREDWEALLIEIKASGVKPRVQAALGREWEELRDRLVLADHLGWGIDILVDRSLNMLVTPNEVSTFKDVRWIVCPLRFFNLSEILQSLSVQNLQRPVLWSFFEPRDSHTLLLNPDEVILAQKALGDLPTLILRSSLNSRPGFYQSPTLEMYQENFIDLGSSKKVRGLVASRLKDFPQLFSVLMLLVSFFSARPLTERLAAIPFWKLGRVKWFGVRVMGTVQLFLIRVYWKIHRFVSEAYGGLRALSVKIYWWSRSRGSSAYWFVRICGIRLYWWSFPKVKRALFIIFWPVLKMYWFLKYQYETRVYPAVKGLLTDD